MHAPQHPATSAALNASAPPPQAQPLRWPAAPLTQHQLRRRAAQEHAMRTGRVARWPQVVA